MAQPANSAAALTTILLTGDPTVRHDAARTFCLAVIKEFYGFDYRPDWHADLDALCGPAAASCYAAQNRGAFWLLNDAGGDIVATAGLYRLAYKAELAKSLATRYPQLEKVASTARVYVRKDWRGRGLGRYLNQLVEKAAPEMDYDTLYLHASSDADATLKFWQASGYTPFGTIGFSTHFDKRLVA